MKIFLLLNESIGRRFFLELISLKGKVVGIAVDSNSQDFDFYLKKTKKYKFNLFDTKSIKTKNFFSWYLKNEIDLSLNIFSYKIIPNNLIKNTKIGFFNLHPGKLPEYAGLNPISWTILSGESYQYVTLHWLTKKIDSGPIVDTNFFKILEKDSALTVMQKSVNIGIRMLKKFINSTIIEPKNINKIEQIIEKRNYYGNQIPNNGYVNFNSKSIDIYNFIRAFNYKPYNSFWKEPKIIVNNKLYYLIKIKISNQRCKKPPGTIKLHKNTILVSSLDRWIIIEKIKKSNSYIDPTNYLRDKEIVFKK